jgi:hypothetical protein
MTRWRWRRQRHPVGGDRQRHAGGRHGHRPGQANAGDDTYVTGPGRRGDSAGVDTVRLNRQRHLRAAGGDRERQRAVRPAPSTSPATPATTAHGAAAATTAWPAATATTRWPPAPATTPSTAVPMPTFCCCPARCRPMYALVEISATDLRLISPEGENITAAQQRRGRAVLRRRHAKLGRAAGPGRRRQRRELVGDEGPNLLDGAAGNDTAAWAWAATTRWWAAPASTAWKGAWRRPVQRRRRQRRGVEVSRRRQRQREPGAGCGEPARAGQRGGVGHGQRFRQLDQRQHGRQHAGRRRWQRLAGRRRGHRLAGRRQRATTPT